MKYAAHNHHQEQDVIMIMIMIQRPIKLPGGLKGFSDRVCGLDRVAKVMQSTQSLCCARGNARNVRTTLAQRKEGRKKIAINGSMMIKCHHVQLIGGDDKRDGESFSQTPPRSMSRVRPSSPWDR